MGETTERVLNWARLNLEDYIANLLDDPSHLISPYRQFSPQVEIGELRALAKDLGLDYDELVAKGSSFERERLRQIESGEIKPAEIAR